jgi:acylglycerol lipase
MHKSPLFFLTFAFVAGCAGCSGPRYTSGLRKAAAEVTSPAEGVAHREARFTGVGGVSLFEESWAPATGEPKAALVIMHGLKDHADRYAGFAAECVKHGYAVHAFDMRGHGDSEGDRVWVDKFDDYVTDLDGFIKQVQAQHPGKPVYLMGHSMGGAISTLAVMDKHSPVSGLILSAPALKPGKDVNGFLIFVTGMLGSATPHLGVLDLKDENFSRDPKVVADIKADPLVSHEAGPARTAKELLGALDKIGQHMEDVNVPLLLLHGTADKLTNPDGSKELAQRAKSTDKTLKIYDGLFHDLLHEPEKAQVMGDVLTWMDAHTPATAPATAATTTP